MSDDPTKMNAVLALVRGGPIRARDLDPLGAPRSYLKRLEARGQIERISRGLYRASDAPVGELASLLEVSRRVPHATVCLLSALPLHDLTTEVPHAVWILIDRSARRPTLASPRLEVVRASGPALSHGIEVRDADGINLRVTGAAKTVADCFRFRRRVGLDVALAALRDYLRHGRGPVRDRGRFTIDQLVTAARADRVYSVMKPYLEALA